MQTACVRMGRISFLWALFLVLSYQNQGSSAVTPLFVKKGNNATLEVDVGEKNVIVWRFNQKDVLVTFFPGGRQVSTAYEGRIEFDAKNFSVKLTNLQESDSGVYTAGVLKNEEEIQAEYNITVQDAVSPLELTVNSAFNTSDSCNIAVTCSTANSHINSTFSCDTKTCHQEGGEQPEATHSGASLHVYLWKESIICNHSNQVSWTKDVTEIKRFCPQHAGPESRSDGVSFCQVKKVVFPVGLVIMVSAVVSVHLVERFKKQK